MDYTKEPLSVSSRRAAFLFPAFLLADDRPAALERVAGLGLAVSRNLVEASGGSIEVESPSTLLTTGRTGGAAQTRRLWALPAAGTLGETAAYLGGQYERRK